MKLAHPMNAAVIAYLTRTKRDSPEYATPDQFSDAYHRAGCHPEIVERLWDELGTVLPIDSRCLVYGIPALVIPENGIIIGLGMGTKYGLRLPGNLAQEALYAGAQASTKWSTGETMSIGQDLGPDWVFGAWLKSELNWCKSACDMLQSQRSP